MRLLTLSALLASCYALAGCSDTLRRPLGDSCGQDSECESGLCYAGVCLDPEGDDDGDGLLNAFEISLGSSPLHRDSDGDGIEDPDELGDSLAVRDTDGDGKPDIIESRLLDNDSDCITDELDADDLKPADDLTFMRPQVCPSLGVCQGQDALLGVKCTPKGPICVYDALSNYEPLDDSCDGLDNNCNGVADDGCQGPRDRVLSPTGGHRIQSSNYRATLMFGTPAAGVTQSGQHRAILQITPLLQPPQETP